MQKMSKGTRRPRACACGACTRGEKCHRERNFRISALRFCRGLSPPSVTRTLQARRLDRGPIEPDQVQLLNPLLVVCFVPLFDAAVRRLSALPRRWRWLRPTPLRRMTAGCFLTAAA